MAFRASRRLSVCSADDLLGVMVLPGCAVPGNRGRPAAGVPVPANDSVMRGAILPEAALFLELRSNFGSSRLTLLRLGS